MAVQARHPADPERSSNFQPLTKELEEREEAEVVQEIVATLPEIIRERRWNGLKIQNRDVYSPLWTSFNGTCYAVNT